MPAELIKLSIVCPAFNEEQVLALFHHRLAEVLAQLPAEYQPEIVYVDDGSRDHTLAILRALARQDRRVHYLSFCRNFGHQAALLAGIEAARGDVLITMDSDLQHPPTLIPALLEQWRAGHEIVITIRDQPEDGHRLEHRLSQGFYRLMGWLSDTEIRPAAADFRLMSRRATQALLRMRDAHPFLRGMIQWLGFTAAEVHYTPANRAAGSSKYSLRRKINLALDGILSFSKVPLRVPALAGMLVMACGFAALLYALPAWLLAPASRVGFRAFWIGSLYLLGGGILWGLGVIGEYLGRIYDQVRGRPLYIIREESPRDRTASSDEQPAVRPLKPFDDRADAA